jgi:CubicO group peptidase (beta-lactamase class C family)
MSADDVARSIEVFGVARDAAAGCAAKVSGGSVREVGGATTRFFDLASVTKPMTAVAAVRADIDPATLLGALLAEARGTASESVSLELLLAHRAGLAAHRTLYAPLLRGGTVDVAAALREAAGARRPDALGEVPAGGFEPLYSDLGYILAGEAIARAVGARDAGEAIDRLVIEPLGVARQAGTIRELASRGIGGPFAPTEDVSWRGGVVTGAVHDENAWALTGSGGSGHAGIFGTIDAVLTFGCAVLDALDERGGPDRPGPSGPFADRSLRWLVRERPGGTLRAGFDGKSLEASSGGCHMGRNSVGHLGFTGTSLWIDPDAKVVVALLTNRVFPSRADLAIRAARPWAHDALFERAVLLQARE